MALPISGVIRRTDSQFGRSNLQFQLVDTGDETAGVVTGVVTGPIRGMFAGGPDQGACHFLFQEFLQEPLEQGAQTILVVFEKGFQFHDGRFTFGVGGHGSRTSDCVVN